jgi:hypothetical protein
VRRLTVLPADWLALPWAAGTLLLALALSGDLPAA